MPDPGDTARYPDYTAGGTISNAGDEPAVIVGVATIGTEDSGMIRPKLPTDVPAHMIALAGPAD